MKRIILIAALLLPVSAWAGGLMMSSGAVGGGGACTTPTTADTLNEGFPAGYDDTWVESIGDPSDGTALPGSPPESSCSTGILFDANNVSLLTYWDNGAVIDTGTSVTIATDAYIPSGFTWDNYGQIIFMAWSSNTSGANHNARVFFRNVSGSLQVAALPNGGTASSYISVPNDEWFVLTLHMNGPIPANSYLAVGSTQASFTRSDTYDGRYLLLGPYAGVGGAESADFYVGYASLDQP